MNRVDRLFGILLQLQQRRRVRAQDLATRFEVSERTIYRDMTALCEIGVPIAALPGEGYELMEGYYLRPLVFTPDEAGALALAAQMFLSQASGRVAAAGQTALAKITAILPEATRQQADTLLQMVRFMLPPTRLNLDDARLVLFQQAISQQRCVFLRYHSYTRDETTERVVEPLRLTFSGEAWYLSAFCQLRQSERAFRLDRIDAWRLLDETFIPRSVVPTPSQPVLARIRIAPHAVRWVRERQHYGFQHADAVADDTAVIMTYRVDAIQELLPWLLSWGAAAEALDPPALRDAQREEAVRLLAILT
jgi:predicted DNA-binding transcriptional regulator YafY